MTVKELMEELMKINERYQDCDVMFHDTEEGRTYPISYVDDEPEEKEGEHILLNF
jgi:hypothetical protein|tara:strand:+ start:3323 stop:3487 length:165 start_codon:yes stop_codon:yes gene_type:complete